MTYIPPTLVYAQVFYDNLLRSSLGTVTYNGTEVLGMESVNAYDWRDFTLFQPQATKVLEVDFVAATDATTIAIWWVEAGTDTVLVEYWNGAAWVTITTLLQTAGLMQWFDFTLQSRTKYRFTFSGTSHIRQLTIGTKVTFPMGQWMDINPPTLIQGVVVENQISVNGSIIGRNRRRFEKMGQISLDFLDPSWVRTTWNDLINHSIRYPFWYRWSPVAYPADVAFAVADSITAPKNMNPPPKMHTELAIKFLTP